MLEKIIKKLVQYSKEVKKTSLNIATLCHIKSYLPNAGLMLGHLLPRWPSFEQTLDERRVFGGMCYYITPTL